MRMLPVLRQICPTDHVITQLHVNAPIACPGNLRLSSIVAVSEETSMPFATIPYLHNLKFGHESSRLARPAAINNLLILPRPISGCSKCDVRASFRRFSQGITFEFCCLVGQKFAKKSSASTRKAADKFSRKQLDFERALPKDGFARLADCSGWRSLLKSSNMYSSRRVLGKFHEISSCSLQQ